VPDDDIYRALQRHLDRMPVPFPATGSGVELSILRRLFSPEDARLALCLSAIPEPVATIHRRAGKTMARAALAAALDGMSGHGLIQRVPARRGVMYGKSPLVVGFYETQVDRLTADLCNGCLVCETRCQMEAIACDAGPAAVKVERCIGCGLCVTTCATGAVRLAANPGARVPPKDTGRLYARMYRERFGALALAAGRRLIGARL
jgi:ferredoxin